MKSEFELLKSYSEIPGSSFKIPRATNVLSAVESYPFAELVSCKTNGKEELIELRLEVQLPQVSSRIERYENIAVIFSSQDTTYPEVLSLREDFPSDVPHLNLRDYDIPKSLCVYEVPFDELKHTLSGHKLIDDIRTWLRLTAIGTLHQSDQPLEPLLGLDEGIVFFTQDALLTSEVEAIVLNEIDGRAFVLCMPHSLSSIFPDRKADQYHVVYLRGNIVLQHGVISRTPKNIGDLAVFLSKSGLDLKLALFDLLKELGNKDQLEYNLLLNKKILFLIELPKSKDASSGSVFYDSYSFFSRLSIRDIGIAIGLYQIAHGNLGTLMVGVQEAIFENVLIGMMRPQRLLTSELARIYNGVTDYPEKEPVFFCIGAGALGSHAFLNLARSGYGLWKLVDNDVVLPHNLARHTADLYDIAKFKAGVLSAKANRLNSNSQFSIPIIENVLRPKQEEVLYDRLEESDIVIDFSASVAVERHLANNTRFSSKRVASFFLNPKGDALVMLMQDENREHPLDFLEMQYYRFVMNNGDLAGHLEIESVNGFRFSNSCRDISGRIPQDAVSVFSGITSSKVKLMNTNKDAEITLWTMSKETDITKYSIPISRAHSASVAGWTILWDDFLLEKLIAKRRDELPNETGGILLGAFDLLNRKLYVVDSILSPTDSEEYPYAYIRGIKGVREQLDKIDRETAGMIQYIGEWHSHPEGASVKPSNDDKLLQKWLTEHMSKSGLPGLMFIVGDDNVNMLITEME